MNWDAIGAVAELAGALAVVVTLVYLSMQLRQNSQLLKATIANSQRESSNQVSSLLAADREAREIFWKGSDKRETLSELERQHFDAVIALYFETLLQNFEQNLHHADRRTDWMLSRPGIMGFWRDYEHMYEQEFRTYVSTRLAALKS